VKLASHGKLDAPKQKRERGGEMNLLRVENRKIYFEAENFYYKVKTQVKLLQSNEKSI